MSPTLACLRVTHAHAAATAQALAKRSCFPWGSGTRTCSASYCRSTLSSLHLDCGFCGRDKMLGRCVLVSMSQRQVMVDPAGNGSRHADWTTRTSALASTRCACSSRPIGCDSWCSCMQPRQRAVACGLATSMVASGATSAPSCRWHCHWHCHWQCQTPSTLSTSALQRVACERPDTRPFRPWRLHHVQPT